MRLDKKIAPTAVFTHKFKEIGGYLNGINSKILNDMQICRICLSMSPYGDSQLGYLS